MRKGFRFVVIITLLAGIAWLVTRENPPFRRIKSPESPSPAKIVVETSPVSRETRFTTSFAPVVQKAAPSVVNIYTTKLVRERRESLPFFNDPLFRHFFGDPWEGQPRTRREQSLGSGVIVTEDGYILTNNHVVDQADEIKVALQGTSQTYTAQLIGTDPQTDIAVIKINAEKIPAITIADSDKLEVGDVVLAIGNPFGVGQTVTMGIVSATGRGGFGIVDYEDFIQTDASINPGNSGGALVDAEGRLVGINTAILSRTGGNQGVGFAVPINMARGVMERIITDGKVIRSYLGVGIQDLTPELAREFDARSDRGALVGEIWPNTPAAEAGIKPGDIITEINGRKINDSRGLRLIVALTPPGTKSTLKLLRGGKEMTVEVTVREMPKKGMQPPTSRERPPAPRPESTGGLLRGIEVANLDSRWRDQFEIPPHIQGALVMNVDTGSPAYAAGLRPGDVIMEINRQPVRNSQEAVALSRDAENGEKVLLRVWSNGGTRFVVLEPLRNR